MTLRTKRVTVVGLESILVGRSQQTRWLAERGRAKVLISDKEPAEKLAGNSMRQLDGLPIVSSASREHRTEGLSRLPICSSLPRRSHPI